MARARRVRGLRETLGTIVLGLEIIVVFLGALAVFGLGVVSPPLALGGGAVVIVLAIAAIGTLKGTLGVVLGWIVQAALVASGVLVPELYLVGALFVALWAYCMIVGGRIDRRNAAAE